MKNVKILTLFLLPAMLFLTSCSIFPTPEVAVTRYFDLSTPEKISLPGKNILVLPFSSNSGDRYKMALRNGNSIRSSEACKWIMPPGSLMTKYLRLAFRSEAGEAMGKEEVTLSGSISAFESEKKEAVLGLTYRLRKVSGGKVKEFSRTILLRQKFNEPSPEAFAKAMSLAAGKAAESIAQDIRKL